MNPVIIITEIPKPNTNLVLECASTGKARFGKEL